MLAPLFGGGVVVSQSKAYRVYYPCIGATTTERAGAVTTLAIMPQHLRCSKAFESPHTHSSCFEYLRQYTEESFSKAACMVAPKSIFSYPQVNSFGVHNYLKIELLSEVCSCHALKLFEVMVYLANVAYVYLH